MKPDIPLALKELARVLTADVAPALPPGPTAGDLALWAASLDVLSQRLDGYVADLVAQNDRLEALLRRAQSLTPGPLAKELADLAQMRPEGLRISQLEAHQAALLEGLIDAQTALEASDGAAERALGDAIWRELADVALQRRFPGAPF